MNRPERTLPANHKRQHQWLKRWLKLWFTGILALLFVVGSGYRAGVVANATSVPSLSRPSAATPAALMAEGQRLFELGHYGAAAETWQKAAAAFAEQGDPLQQVRSVNNVVQTYQQLGRWAEATSLLEQNLSLLQSLASAEAEYQATMGQTLTVQGNLALAQAQPREALEAFKLATNHYQAADHPLGLLRSQVNQARALRAAGLYHQAIDLLKSITPSLGDRTPSVEAAAGLRTLGELQRTVGELENSQAALTASLGMAEQLGQRDAIATTQLSLAATVAAAGNGASALRTYGQVVQSLHPELAVRAGIAQLSLLVRQGNLSQVSSILDGLIPALQTLPPGNLRPYALIDTANILINTQDRAYRETALAMLTEAMETAQRLENLRAESYALGALGRLYQNAQQLSDAAAFTQKALALSIRGNAPEISYLWNAQLGDLQLGQGDPEAAISNYTAAVNTLETLRRDLVAIDDDVRYDFRETVEPIYRNLVNLLTAPGYDSQDHLQQARAVIEALQLAELENFFREACLPISEDIDQVVDSTDQPTAVLYPIILPDRIEVVLKLPRQPLTHYAASVSEAKLTAKLQQFRRDVIFPHTLNQVKAQATELYRWLVAPVRSQLDDNHITTLVFVLDGALRNIPMGLLYDGDHYLIEDFAVAVAPGLRLVDPKTLSEQNLSVMIAGISEGREPFPPLPFVAEEVQTVESALSSRVLLNQTFTVERLEAAINESPFPVVHLATHGRFSSNPQETFILAWDNQIPMAKLNSLLRNSEQSRQGAIELLVLSACETAEGDRRAALGLAGVAVRAGARSTVASLWNLEDETTAVVMTQFYRALKQPGTSRAEALRQAQLATLKTARYEHPRHWAPYVLIGNWL